MSESAYDVVGIGNAIVDVLSHADDAFITRHGLNKGTMTLVDAARAEELYDAMGPAVEVSGGSAANTIAGVASLGARGAFIGKVKGDQLGTIFRHDLSTLGIRFAAKPSEDGLPTGRCLIIVTPDAKRTMNTYLGASADFGPEDVDTSVVSSGAITYLEGYLWDRPRAKEAFVIAARTAHAAGRTVALSLSDPFCVDRHRQDFLDLVRNHVDLLFANEDEIVSLYQQHAFDDAVRQVRGHCPVAVITRSEQGSVVAAGDVLVEVPAEPVEHVVDTTGAGDAYAAGFLWAYVRELSLGTCARSGGIAASEVISHFGARAEQSLATLIEQKLG